MKNKFSIAMTLAVVLAMLLTSLALADTTPTITSDYLDYEPGSTVNLFGVGWQPGESVHIFVNDNVGSTWSRNADVVAAGDGTFTDTFQLPSWFVATYSVTATGATSGTATTMFTDGNASLVSGTVTDAATSLPISGATVSCTISSGCNANISTTTDASGNYSFAGGNKLTFAGNGPATLILTASKSGYTSATQTLTNVNNGDSFTGVNFALTLSDTTPPDTTITANPANPTNSTSASFSFTGTDNITPSGSLTFECKLDAGSFAACSSPKSYSGLSDGSHTFQVRAKDAANNVDPSPASFTWVVDTVAPSVTVTPDRAPDHNGWYNAAVVFDTNGTDSGSGIASCDANQTYTGPDGTGLTVSGSCTDNAGNTATGMSAAFKFDDTNPSVTVTSDRAPDHNGWYNAAVVFDTNGTDANGIESCTADQTYTGPDGTGLTVSGSCTDNAGNVGTGTSDPFDFDNTDPSVTVIPDRAPDHNGWYNAAVVFDTNGTDANAIESCDADQTYTGPDGTGLTVGGSCTDNAGNVGIGTSAAFNYDATAPTISGSASPAANLAGWNNSDVTVSFTCNDNLSGVASCGPNQTLSSDGAGQSATGNVADNAGNTASATVSGINIDKTAPLFGSCPAGGPFLLNSGLQSVGPISVDASISGLNAVASTLSGSVDTGSIGLRTVSFTAVDNADNSASKGCSYSVIYNWNGFFQPIDNLPVLNKAKAGSAIPVKFSLSGNQGLNIFLAGYPVSTVTACGTTTTDTIESTVTAGSSSLSYDALADQYIYVWKTEKAWAGCRTLTVKLADGTVHQANFNFVK